MVLAVDSKTKNIASRRTKKRKSYFWFIFWPIVVLAFFVLIFYLQNKYLFINQMEVGYSPINNRFRLTQTQDIQNQLQSFLGQKWLFFFKKNSDKNYYLDADGGVIYPVTGPLIDLTTNQPLDFPVIYDQTDANSDFKPYLDALKAALQVFDALNGVNYPLVVKTIKISQNSGFFLGEGQADSGPKVYFLLDPNEMVNELARLKILLDQKLQNTVPQYIDLRFGEKVYYK
ncbi:MAG: cell division protein FtsQ/DivIB [Candidatus Parcubacteria bacterium]|nr:cell division protein FtsQ/DivIB [Candidatus Parcubacteria bacterium]